MSIRGTAASAALATLVSGAALVLACSYLPLRLAAQTLAGDSPLHWTRFHPRVDGRVQVEATVNSAGDTLDARVLSGPEELRRPALQLVLARRHAPDQAERRVMTITIDYRKATSPMGTISGAIIGGVPAPPPFEQAVFEGVDYLGLPTDLQQRAAAVMSTLQSGQHLTKAQVEQLRGSLSAIDPSLNLGVTMTSDDTKQVKLRLSVSNRAPGPPPPIRVGGDVQEANLISKVDPVYPPLARQARIQGAVRFAVHINKEGGVEKITLVSGHPLLVQAAQEALSQYKYRPTLLNGNPIPVQTTVDVNFVL